MPEPTSVFARSSRSGTTRHNSISMLRGLRPRSICVNGVRSPSGPHQPRTHHEPHRFGVPPDEKAAAMAQQAIVGEKVGMTQVWAEDNRIVPVTVLRVE